MALKQRTGGGWGMDAAQRTPIDWCKVQQTVLLALIAAAIGGVRSLFHPYTFSLPRQGPGRADPACCAGAVVRGVVRVDTPGEARQAAAVKAPRRESYAARARVGGGTWEWPVWVRRCLHRSCRSGWTSY